MSLSPFFKPSADSPAARQIEQLDMGKEEEEMSRMLWVALVVCRRNALNYSSSMLPNFGFLQLSIIRLQLPTASAIKYPTSQKQDFYNQSDSCRLNLNKAPVFITTRIDCLERKFSSFSIPIIVFTKHILFNYFLGGCFFNIEKLFVGNSAAPLVNFSL